MDGKSLNITIEKLKDLKQLFPDVFSEDKIDWERLRQTFGEEVFVSNEHYELSWAGKMEARREIQKQTTATLTPDPERSVNFESSDNIFIAGENLEVLCVLQKSYFDKIKMIYIDPPYNTGSDSFVYPDDYAEHRADYERRAGIIDEHGLLNKHDLWKKNSRENGQFHSVWLSMMYPRLYLARNLLREDGVMFVSIDDNESATLKLLMDEIFGEENFVEQIVWKSKFGAGAKPRDYITCHEYILVYAKNFDAIRSISIPMTNKAKKMYSKKDEKFAERGYYGTWPLETTSMDDRPNLKFPILWNGQELWPKKQWLWSKDRVEKALANNEIVITEHNGRFSVRYKQYEKDEYDNYKKSTPISVIDKIYTQDGTKELSQLELSSLFGFPKPAKLLKELFKIQINDTEDHSGIILDFFAGSGSTAQAVLELNQEDGGNRRFILVQLPEALDENSEAYKAGYKTIADICTARIKKVIAKLAAEQQTELDFGGQKPDLGFKAYTLDYSNFKIWRRDVEGKDALLAQMALLREPLSEYRGSDAALLTELCLKAGFPLSVDVQERLFEGCKIYDIADGAMWIALERINLPLFQHVAAAKPMRFVTLSSLFTGDNPDETMSSAKLQLHEAGVELKII
ncbi:site-specific DNA-methyltransferase (Adenine-specific) [Candidatus Vecturithrix granuli]|uniref:Site-specific DNA-methyltransferase (Adenine-specific) n=1 Tax=Vecturithrix granuli TaxID=1499967 RepID=A0A081CA67_VECG1|nr:site-specific DNA-methyltransferase (Adenine-specific) [Candidatus Vecturithrix granuli]